MKREGVTGTESQVPVGVGLRGADVNRQGSGGRGWHLGGFVIFSAILIYFFCSTLVALFHHALGRDLHSHIILIPFVSGYLFFLKRAELGFIPSGAPLAGALIVVLGLLAAGLLTTDSSAVLSENDVLAARTALFLMFLFGGALGFFGWLWLRLMTFPFALLIFVIPLPDAAVDGLESMLVAASAEVTHWMFVLGGTPVYRDGLSLQIPGIVLEVARECSGIRSTWVLVITSTIASYLFLQTPWHRVVLIAVVLPLGILRNALRIWVIGLLCVHFGPEMIHSWVHRSGGPLFFAGSLVPLFAMGWFLRRRELR
jgi:exosortase C (VPDSG-CTERM-specific)